jgi:hypothetical protein
MRELALSAVGSKGKVLNNKLIEDCTEYERQIKQAGRNNIITVMI